MLEREPKITSKESHPNEYRTSIDRPTCHEELSVALKWLWRKSGAPETILCIGTDRATGDALGPLVGTHMTSWSRRPFQIFGTLETPIHATNLAEFIRNHPNLSRTRLLAIDASLGKPTEVGIISLGVGAIRPGAGVQKDLPAVGQYYVTGTVNIGGFMDYYVLQNTRLALVMKMAQKIADGIRVSLNL